jgi:hypothetical protein
VRWDGRLELPSSNCEQEPKLRLIMRANIIMSYISDHVSLHCVMKYQMIRLFHIFAATSMLYELAIPALSYP